jgi:SpoVK/Ycf46/Vps4 family AAA+-type ATPase
VAKSLAYQLHWNYVEIPPGELLSNGPQNIIQRINYIFKRLMRLKNTIVFFDEVDQLVEARTEGGSASSKWIVTSLLPVLQQLRQKGNIKFIMATNIISQVDPAIMRRGRIDFVLPMGAICWKDRLRMLVNEVGKIDINRSDFDEYRGIFEGVTYKARGKKSCKLAFIKDEALKSLKKSDIKDERLQRYLRRTDFVQVQDLQDIVKIFTVKDKSGNVRIDKNIKDKTLYVKFFGENDDISAYENMGLRRFHDIKFLDFIVLPFEFTEDKKRLERTMDNNTFSNAYFRTTDIDDYKKLVDELFDNTKKDKAIFNEYQKICQLHKYMEDGMLPMDDDKILLIGELNHILYLQELPQKFEVFTSGIQSLKKIPWVANDLKKDKVLYHRISLEGLLSEAVKSRVSDGIAKENKIRGQKVKPLIKYFDFN